MYFPNSKNKLLNGKRDVIKSPSLGMQSDYNRSLKHMSEKFQHLMQSDRAMEDPVRTRYNANNKVNSPFDGRIQGSSLKKRNYEQDQWQNKYFDESIAQNQQKPVQPTDATLNMQPRVVSAVNGSQHFKNSEALLEVLIRGKGSIENRGH